MYRNYIVIFLICIGLSSCATQPPKTDYVIVTPVKYVEPIHKPNSQSGWLETDAVNATAFKVKIGNKQYFKLLDRVGKNKIIDELALYAEQEVIKIGHCSSNQAKTKNKGIYGPHTAEYVFLVVECVVK